MTQKTMIRTGAVLPLDYRKLTAKQREKWQLAMLIAADAYGVEDVEFKQGRGAITGMRPYALLIWLLRTCVFETSSELARHLGIDVTTVKHHVQKVSDTIDDTWLEGMCEQLLR